jgi:glycine/D-amino acid oxidase-like deaminating enzyme
MSSLSCDVAIIGAGPAGVAAAVAAAESRARVVLIDAASRLGGSVTAGMHRALCGLYARAPQSPMDTLNGGIQRRLVERMVCRAPAAVVPRQLGQVWVLEFPTDAWEAALAGLCADAQVELRLGTRVTEVRRDDAHLSAVRLDGPAPAWLKARVVIDCTGDGRVLQLAGDYALLPPDRSGTRMLGGYALRLAGLTGDLESLRLAIPYALAQAVEQGLLPPAARFTMFHPGPEDGAGVCKLALHPDDFAADSAARFADRVLRFLIHDVPELAAAQVIEHSPRVLPRDGRHLRGRYVVSESDILTARSHGPDAVRAWWPIERWDVSSGPTYTYPPPEVPYEIPEDALQSAVLDNVLAAGNCLSATPTAAASLRAAGICLATGAAAGRLAARQAGCRP